MVEDRDAARIRREKEARRAIERLHIEEERRLRQAELARLGGESPDDSASPSEPDPQTEAPDPTAGRESPPLESEVGEPAIGPAPFRDVLRPRAIGGAIPPSEMDAFLRIDPAEGFDLVKVNDSRLPRFDSAASDNVEMVVAVAERAGLLMIRVKREEDDPLSVGAFLRDRVLEWYSRSENDPEWAKTAPRSWGGLFADSRAAGGHLVPWINVRLRSLRDSAAKSGQLRRRVRSRLSRDKSAQSALLRTASQQINAEVAQALLDDLAARPRTSGEAAPLVRLSELAVRRQVVTVNDSLAAIFSGPETGPFVVLHPNRYPNCEEMLIRPPAPGSTGAAMAYSLAPGRPVRKGPGRGRPTGEGGPQAGAEGSPDEGEFDIDAGTVWDAPAVSKDDWVRIVGEKRRERSRLDPPPKDYRVRAAYAPLRDLALGDAEFRKTFLVAKWRGRPAGLPLLVAMLQKGTLAPEVSTDHEYLEAELGELAQGDPQWRPPDGVWTLPGWKVTREGDRPGEYRYRADPA